MVSVTASVIYVLPVGLTLMMMMYSFGRWMNAQMHLHLMASTFKVSCWSYAGRESTRHFQASPVNLLHRLYLVC